MADLDRHIDGVGELISLLEKRLQPVLRPDNRTEAAANHGSAPADPRAELTQRVSGYALRTQRSAEAIDRLLNRLAL